METKKYVNKNGNVIVIKQDTTGFSPMYENQTTLNYSHGRKIFHLCKKPTLTLCQNGLKTPLSINVNLINWQKRLLKMEFLLIA